jgi:hypothetical protein
MTANRGWLLIRLLGGRQLGLDGKIATNQVEYMNTINYLD